MYQNKLKPTIFIGSSCEGKPLANAIQECIFRECEPRVWYQDTFSTGKYNLDELTDELQQAHFAIFVCNEDDVIEHRGEQQAITRDNVILEIGMSLGILGKERTFLVVPNSPKLKLPSDLDGLVHATFNIHSSGDLTASVGPACNKVLKTIKKHFKDFKTPRELREEELFSLRERIRLSEEVPGRRLFEYKDYYPIKLDEQHRPSIDIGTYKRALTYFLDPNIQDRLAAMDLVYLHQNNLTHLGDFLTPEMSVAYEELKAKYKIDADSFAEKNDISLKNYIKVINDLGDTFKDVCAEFILHNVRNPIRSIVAARNTEFISGRKIGDPSTRFVYQYVKHQGKSLMRSLENGSKVSYLKQFNGAKQVKATTIPIYDPKFGLIGIICINIDMDDIKAMDTDAQVAFFENYVKNTGKTPVFEREQYQ